MANDYSKRMVAFIDILGFKDIVKQSENDNSKLKHIYDCLTLIKNREKNDKWDLTLIKIKEDAQKRGVETFDISKTLVCTCFSDSIVVSTECTDKNINEVLSTLICNISVFGAELISKGVLIRGAITTGKLLHIENGIIVGPALIEAYELENKAAKQPRIILSDKVIRKLNYPLERKENRYPYHQYVRRFTDGCVGFHQLSFFEPIQAWEKMSNSKLKQALAKVKLTIIEGLDSTFEKPDVHEKYLWLKEQYDDLCILQEGIKELIIRPEQKRPKHNIYYSK